MLEADRRRAGLADVRAFVEGVYGDDLHAKRIASLAGATLGVMWAASLAVAMVGRALAQARGLVPKHAIKQVDRLLGNRGIDVWESFARWVPHRIGARREALVAMDWTDFDHDGQATLVLSLVTGHGRAAPRRCSGPASGRTSSRRGATASRMPACAAWPTSSRPAAGSPSWPTAASATRSCSPSWPSWASAS